MKLVYLVTYDLNVPGKDYTALINRIKSLGAWAKPLKSAFFIDCALSESKIGESLGAVMDPTDRLVVMKLTASWYGYLDREVIDWVAERRLPA